MEFLAEFLLEFAFELADELFLENGIEMADNRRLPKWARVLILAVTALVFAAVFGIILLVGISALSHTPLLALLLFALDAGFVFLCFFKIRRLLRRRSRK